MIVEMSSMERSRVIGQGLESASGRREEQVEAVLWAAGCQCSATERLHLIMVDRVYKVEQTDKIEHIPAV